MGTCPMLQVIANTLKNMGLKYRGTAVNKQMVLSAGHVREMFDEGSMAVLKILEREHGRDLLSNQYTKLSRVLGLVKSHAPSVAAAGRAKEVHGAARRPDGGGKSQ